MIGRSLPYVGQGFSPALRPALIALLVLFCAACGRADIPTAPVTRGEFIDWAQLQGEVKASRSITLRAPMEAGDLRLIHVAPNGSPVKTGAIVVEFDASTVQRTIDEKRTEVNAFQAEIEKAEAEASTRRAEGLTAETTARFDVERAKLDYSGREALSRVEAEQTRLRVLDAEHKLREAEAKRASLEAETRATLATAIQTRDKARQELERAEAQVAALRIAAPAEGTVTVLPNPRTPWMARQPFKPGDQVWPGAEIAQLPDPSSLYVAGRVDEVERGRIRTGQSVRIRAEALPDRELAAHVERISQLARADFTAGWPPPRNFDLTVALDDADPRLRVGTTVTLRIAVDRLEAVLTVPSEAVFSRDGEDVVYVMKGRRPERRPIEIDRRNSERVVVGRGLADGEQVALVDPLMEGGR